MAKKRIKRAEKAIEKPVSDDPSTEEKIKNAAREVFHKKGFAGARTRDIAETAGINLALLNYYFRSKEKLFAIIMAETMQGFIQSVQSLFNEKETTLEAKIEAIVNNYIDLLKEHPEIPLFIVNELRANPEALPSKMGLNVKLKETHFVKQLQERMKGKAYPVHPMHLIMNMMGLVIFPFVMSPLIRSVAGLKQEEFYALMEQRRKLIPLWLKEMIEAQ